MSTTSNVKYPQNRFSTSVNTGLASVIRAESLRSISTAILSVRSFVSQAQNTKTVKGNVEDGLGLARRFSVNAGDRRTNEESTIIPRNGLHLLFLFVFLFFFVFIFFWRVPTR